MNNITQLKPIIHSDENIVAMVTDDPGLVLLDDNLYDLFMGRLRSDVRAFVPDLSTVTSRKKISSEAYKITRYKTAIDDAGKKLNEDARRQINTVDAKRRAVRTDLDALADEARRPLTQWEKQEEARVDYCKAILKAIEDCGNGLIGGQPQPFGILLHELEKKLVVTSELAEFEDQARVAHRIATDKLKAAFEAHQRAEADRIELEKLRAEAAERDRIEALRVAKEREAAETAERERMEKERQEQAAAALKAREEHAAQAAREQAEREAKAAIDRAEQEKAAAIAKAEAEVRAVQEEAARKEREREETARREQAEQAARERNRAHRSRIMGEAKQALMTKGLDEATAKKVIQAIVACEIPHIRANF